MANKDKAIVLPVVAEEVIATPPSNHTKDMAKTTKQSSFGKKFYFVDLTRVRKDKGPNQLRGIIRWMIDKGHTSEETAVQGSIAGTMAIEDGYVQTAKLTGPVIFAYYRSTMEKEYGLELAKTLHAKTGKRMDVAIED